MEQWSQLLEYTQAHPAQSLAAIFGVIGIYFLLNRKSRLVREAEERIAELRRSRPDEYNKLRPPR